MYETIIFGGSYARIFKYFLPNVTIYKGATIKGLLNKNNNYINILNKLENKYENGIFHFGITEFQIYYILKRYINKIDHDTLIKNIYNFAEQYVKLISELPNLNNKYICNILPSVINSSYLDEYININIKSQGNILDEDIKNIKIYLTTKINKYIKKFNKLLKKYCKIYNIYYVNIYKLLYDKNKKIKEFLIINNIFKDETHMRYGYLFLYYVSYTKLKFLIKDINLKELINQIKNDENNFLINKLEKMNIEKYFDKYKFNSKIILKILNKEI